MLYQLLIALSSYAMITDPRLFHWSAESSLHPRRVGSPSARRRLESR